MFFNLNFGQAQAGVVSSLELHAHKIRLKFWDNANAGGASFIYFVKYVKRCLLLFLYFAR